MKCTLICDRQRIGRATSERWANDLSALLAQIPAGLNTPVRELQAGLSARIPGDACTPGQRAARESSYVPPQTELERTIAGVWQRMFGVPQVGSEDNFFDLGGTSLLLVQMHQQLQEALNTEFPVVTLFKHRTVRSLARELSATDVAVTAGATSWRERAARQKRALTRLGVLSKK